MRIFTQKDIIIYQIIELAAGEIKDKKIKGCIAELGVYKGDFAKRINIHFPGRTLYLFDTFNGFDKRDVEIENRFNSNAKENDFTNNNIELVLKKMKYPKNCIVKEGWFPETTKDIDERFAFVSIDADLFEPIYQGLLYFYERLEKGGYIFVHDYNGKLYGAKEAVQKFSKGFNVPYVPLSDLCGTVVFSK
jgi:O-methyltransferase